ncbi:thiopurine S-methyltransferase [Ancylobacter aquaticus]|uniref:Thiopurine S-methyltransferase n=1 Tax=Ancylobacter aquaticus TaxID=100 RepID=A0A4R1I1M5_ANCAQ|nr:thiopurine S-methyltransferase [Ancylobacter aquaticus]TCK29074.1 thiopurine S-methyltransferase [Ancylobacter aquaticus]
MDPDFWHKQWEANEIAFHEGAANPLLVRHFSALGVHPGARVFVPLCGKSHDLHWLLAHGFTVAGAELSRLAVEQLFTELGVAPEISEIGPLERFAAEGITVFVGDIFDLTRDVLGPVDAIYDRAALVALPEAMRERYAGHLVHLTHSARQLLITFDYDQSLTVGPPFAVDEHEVRRLYGAPYHPSLLEKHPLKGGIRGKEPVVEDVWKLERR